MADIILDKSKEINNLILNSVEYHKYCLYRKELNQSPELKEKVQEFRMRNFYMHLEGDQNNQGAGSQLEDEYREMLTNPLVSSYLNAELNFCRMMQAITKNIYKGIELELDFL